IINEESIESYFRQIDDPLFQVTGGHLTKINDRFYLLGGQKFLGRYNPMGPDHGPGFTQEYTNAIRIFKINDDGKTITIEHLPSHIDRDNLHRRDYNAVEQKMPNGEEGVTMISGVFREDDDLPFLNSVDVSLDNYEVNNEFKQYYNHYHCPVLPLYSESENLMHTIFFGGIAQFYDNNGTLVQDDNVPFVNTIARVTRDKDGNMVEYKMSAEMPALLGAGGEFIPNLSLPQYDNGIFKLDELSGDDVLIGYIYGGISSTAPNIFTINDGSQSVANNKIFSVYLSSGTKASVDDINESSISDLEFSIYPNPSKKLINVEYKLKSNDIVRISITDVKGKQIDDITFTNQTAGKHTYTKTVEALVNGGIYFLTIETKNETITRKLVIER
ncbi:MAG: T9SS type A sorting domain-containing protein, partial [Candidatus Kapaibacterium sp.]